MNRLSLIALLAFAGCGQTFHDQYACRRQVGHEPNMGLGAFGVIGAMAQQQTPEWQEWSRYLSACLQTKAMEAAR